MDGLNTGHGVVTKGDIKKWLAQRDDISDDSEVGVIFDRGQIVVTFKWSQLSGSFGEDFIIFDETDSKEVAREAYNEWLYEG